MISEEFQEECIAAVQTTVSQLNSKLKCLLNGIDCPLMDKKNIFNIIEEYSPFTPQIVSFHYIKQAFNDVNKWGWDSIAKFVSDFISLNEKYGTKFTFEVCALQKSLNCYVSCSDERLVLTFPVNVTIRLFFGFVSTATLRLL